MVKNKNKTKYRVKNQKEDRVVKFIPSLRGVLHGKKSFCPKKQKNKKMKKKHKK